MIRKIARTGKAIAANALALALITFAILGAASYVDPPRTADRYLRVGNVTLGSAYGWSIAYEFGPFTQDYLYLSAHVGYCTLSCSRHVIACSARPTTTWYKGGLNFSSDCGPVRACAPPPVELSTAARANDDLPVAHCEFGFPGWFAQFGLIYPFAIWVRPFLRRRRRRTRGLCIKCDYDLTGNTTGVCPECGTAIRAGTSGAK